MEPRIQIPEFFAHKFYEKQAVASRFNENGFKVENANSNKLWVDLI